MLPQSHRIRSETSRLVQQPGHDPPGKGRRSVDRRGGGVLPKMRGDRRQVRGRHVQLGHAEAALQERPGRVQSAHQPDCDHRART